MKSQRVGRPRTSEGQTKASPPRPGFRLVRPYSTLAGAKAALDNGGRFFNLFARSGDERVSRSELSKAAGVLFDEANSLLFLDMALAKLSADEKAQVVAMLPAKQVKRYRQHAPRQVSLTAAARKPAKSVVITEGLPRFQREITILQAGILMVGKVTVPVTNRLPYDLYELLAVDSASASGLRLAIWHQATKLARIPTRFGGLLSEQRVQEGSGEAKQLLLLPAYHTPLG